MQGTGQGEGSQSPLLTYHTAAQGSDIPGARETVKRCLCRKIRGPYCGAERRKWDKVRTEPLLHCRQPTKK